MDRQNQSSPHGDSRLAALAGLAHAPPVIGAGQRVDVTVSFRVPAAATPEQLVAWLRFELGYNGSLDGDNPLREAELEADIAFGFVPQVRLR